jgi:hypothetical protein
VARGDSEIRPYAVVEIIETPRTVELEVAGAMGVVLGGSDQHSETESSHVVLVRDVGRTVMLSAAELRATGEMLDRADIYDGTTLSVSEGGEVRLDDMDE